MILYKKHMILSKRCQLFLSYNINLELFPLVGAVGYQNLVFRRALHRLGHRVTDHRISGRMQTL